MHNLIEAEYQCDGSSIHTDDVGMREMQRRAYSKAGSQYLLIKSPPASGKSRALMYIALEKLRQKQVKKVIVAVPERSIGKSFQSTVLTDQGFHSDWKVTAQYDLCRSRGNIRKSDAFQEFMDSEEQIVLCTHSTLRFAFDQIAPEAFGDCLVAIDEFHHVSSEKDNKLGELLRSLMAGTNASILAMTGSYFRGDRSAVLSPRDESKFSKVTFNYYEQLNGYQYLKSLGIGFHFYQGRYLDAVDEVLDTSKKTIIYIPSVNSSESTKEKYFEVDSIIDVIGEFSYTDESGIIHVKAKSGKILKVADLVNDNQIERDKVVEYLRNIEGEDEMDIIIALGMAKEGFDWPFCETTLTIGYRGSLTEIVQIIGRCTRDSPNKTHAQFTNLISEPDAEKDEIVDSVNNMLKAIAASLLMEEVIAPKFNFGGSRDNEGDGVELKIKGYKAPSSQKVQDIIDNDITDLKANIIQSPEIQSSFAGAIEPEIINRVLVPKVIKEIYPDLDDNECEELGEYVVASFVLNGSNFEKKGRDKFLKFSDNLINVTELNMDLIYSINPFKNAFDVLSKDLNPRVLKAVQQCIQAVHIRITDDEAILLWPRINDFVRSTGKAPNLDSIDPIERRMAEALVYINQVKNELS